MKISKKGLESVTIVKIVLLISTCFVIIHTMYDYASYNTEKLEDVLLGLRFFSFLYAPSPGEPVMHHEHNELRKVLKAASTEDKTVVLAFLNKAWAAPNSLFDLFLESFRIGNNTGWILNHLFVVAVDDDAYFRCQSSVSYCYRLNTNLSSELASQANFMTPSYLDMIWTRLSFCHTILNLGYNFLVTDTDIMWLRDPFPHLAPHYDIQTSCDNFNGKENSVNNALNVGFMLVRSNNRTIEFYKYWVSSRRRYPNLHEQDAFNELKYEPYFNQVGLRVRFMSTTYFSGFCEPSRDLDKVCTMHANCCVGLGNKIASLKNTLEDWKTYVASNRTQPQTHRLRATCEYNHKHRT